MSHHYHEDDDYYRQQAIKEKDARLKRRDLIAQQIEALSPEEKARFEQAKALMEDFSKSAEGQALMEGCYGWKDWKDDLWQNPHMAVQLLILSGGLKALTQENVPA